VILNWWRWNGHYNNNDVQYSQSQCRIGHWTLTLKIFPLPTRHTPKHTVHGSVRGCGQLRLIEGNPFAEKARDLPVELLPIEDRENFILNYEYYNISLIKYNV